MSGMKSALKRSSSKMHSLASAKGSVHHIGTTPHKYRFELFISFVQPVKTSDQLCMVLERRGNLVATKAVKVQDGKVVFRESLTMEVTLFGRPVKAKDTSEAGNMKFDEKKAKLSLRKGGPDGKTVGKIHLNMADYIRGPQGTVFADLEMSNGSVAVTKIESELLYSGRDKFRGKKDSELYSEMGDDINGAMENDSIFGDDASDFGDLVEVSVMTTNTNPSPLKQSELRNLSSAEKNKPVQNESKSLREDQAFSASLPEEEGRDASEQKPKEDEPQSFRKKYLSTSASKRLISRSSSRQVDGSGTSGNRKKNIEVLETKIKSLEAENRQLKKAGYKYKMEASSLRKELRVLESKCSKKTTENLGVVNSEESRLRETITMQRSLIANLQAQKEDLLSKLDENDERKTKKGNSNYSQGSDEITKGSTVEEENQRLRNKVEELKTALRREPQFMAVANELKMVKMSLALANMEKEQALFAAMGKENSLGHSMDSPVTPS